MSIELEHSQHRCEPVYPLGLNRFQRPPSSRKCSYYAELNSYNRFIDFYDRALLSQGPCLGFYSFSIEVNKVDHVGFIATAMMESSSSGYPSYKGRFKISILACSHIHTSYRLDSLPEYRTRKMQHVRAGQARPLQRPNVKVWLPPPPILTGLWTSSSRSRAAAMISS